MKVNLNKGVKMANLRDDAPDQLNTIDPTQLSEQIEKLNSINAQISSAEASLKDFTSDDYLLLYGDPALIGVVCAVASDVTNGRFKLLKWDRIQASYFPIEINLFNK